MRLEPSTGVRGSNGILRQGLSRPTPRLAKGERGRRYRGSPTKEEGEMFAGIDVAAERHVRSRLDDDGMPMGRPLAFAEDAAGSRMWC